jgi:hypothetical protein
MVTTNLSGNNIKMKLNMYPSDTIIFLFYYFYSWLLVAASIGHHQASIYKNLKKAGEYSNAETSSQ